MSLRQLIFAIFLNLITLPGGGQWYLKKKKRSFAFMVPTLVVVLIFVAHLTTMLSKYLKALQNLSLHRRFMAMDSISVNVLEENQFAFKCYLFLLIVCYIVSVSDVIWLYLSEKNNNA